MHGDCLPSQVIQLELGAPPASVFSELGETTVAAASLGQVGGTSPEKPSFPVCCCSCAACEILHAGVCRRTPMSLLITNDQHGRPAMAPPGSLAPSQRKGLAPPRWEQLQNRQGRSARTVRTKGSLFVMCGNSPVNSGVQGTAAGRWAPGSGEGAAAGGARADCAGHLHPAPCCRAAARLAQAQQVGRSLGQHRCDVHVPLQVRNSSSPPLTMVRPAWPDALALLSTACAGVWCCCRLVNGQVEIAVASSGS